MGKDETGWEAKDKKRMIWKKINAEGIDVGKGIESCEKKEKTKDMPSAGMGEDGGKQMEME